MVPAGTIRLCRRSRRRHKRRIFCLKLGGRTFCPENGLERFAERPTDGRHVEAACGGKTHKQHLPRPGHHRAASPLAGGARMVCCPPRPAPRRSGSSDVPGRGLIEGRVLHVDRFRQHRHKPDVVRSTAVLGVTIGRRNSEKYARHIMRYHPQLHYYKEAAIEVSINRRCHRTLRVKAGDPVRATAETENRYGIYARMPSPAEKDAAASSNRSSEPGRKERQDHRPGFHHRFGGAHAEVNAIRSCRTSSRSTNRAHHQNPVPI